MNWYQEDSSTKEGSPVHFTFSHKEILLKIKAHLVITIRKKMRKKGGNVTTYRHEWWHTAPSLAVPGPTSRLPSASTASQGVGCIHSSLLSHCCHASSCHPSFFNSLPCLCSLIQFSPPGFSSLLCCFLFVDLSFLFFVHLASPLLHDSPSKSK